MTVGAAPLLAGAMGGLIATVPMTAIMTQFFQKLPESERYPLPPREISEEIVSRLTLHHGMDDTSLTRLSLAAHFAYGGATGAIYPLLFRHARRPFLSGGSYGLAVWVASYLGWLPAAKVLSPATTHPLHRNILMLSAHWVWGACTAVIARGLIARQKPSEKSAK